MWWSLQPFFCGCDYCPNLACFPSATPIKSPTESHASSTVPSRSMRSSAALRESPPQSLSNKSDKTKSEKTKVGKERSDKADCMIWVNIICAGVRSLSVTTFYSIMSLPAEGCMSFWVKRENTEHKKGLSTGSPCCGYKHGISLMLDHCLLDTSVIIFIRIHKAFALAFSIICSLHSDTLCYYYQGRDQSSQWGVEMAACKVAKNIWSPYCYLHSCVQKHIASLSCRLNCGFP